MESMQMEVAEDADGQPVFDALANPSTVKTILKEPYANAEQAAPYRLGRAR